MKKNITFTRPCQECSGTGKVTLSLVRLSPEEASREWKSLLRKAAKVDPGELRRLVIQHREALDLGQSKSSVGEMGAYAALADYIEKHGGEHAVLAALARRAK